MLVEKIRIAGVQGAARSLPDSKGSAFGRVWDRVPLSFKHSEMGEFFSISKEMLKKREKLCKREFFPSKESV